jgi:hypothetical protein
LSNFYLIEGRLQSFYCLLVTGEHHIFFDWGCRLKLWLKHRRNDVGSFTMNKGGNWAHDILYFLSFPYLLTTFLQSLLLFKRLRIAKEFQVLFKWQSFICVGLYCLLKNNLLSRFFRRFFLYDPTLTPFTCLQNPPYSFIGSFIFSFLWLVRLLNLCYFLFHCI